MKRHDEEKGNGALYSQRAGVLGTGNTAISDIASERESGKLFAIMGSRATSPLSNSRFDLLERQQQL